jgi:hypothetical protein
MLKIKGVSNNMARDCTLKINRDVLTLLKVFVNQKRVNICEHIVKMVPHDLPGTIFTVGSHTFTLF